MPVEQIIFDMDGVITSEDGYWRAAGCALLDLAAKLGHGPSRRAVSGEDRDALPWRLNPELPTIARAKSLLINTNWDLCHLAAIALAWRLCAHEKGNALRLARIDWRAEEPGPELIWPPGFEPDLHHLLAEILPYAGPHTGFALLEALAEMTQAAQLFVRKGPVWSWLFRHFQIWFNGTESARKEGLECGGVPARKGIIADERLLLEPASIAGSLRSLRERGFRLGIATGRTRAELLPTLARYNLLQFFTQESIVTHDEVAASELELSSRGLVTHLSKPHPFPFLRALLPGAAAAELVQPDEAPPLPSAMIVGDTLADISAAKAIGVTSVGVLTGPGGAAAREALVAAGATHIIPDVTHLPALFD
jgi:phosphoglycolate phosphatase-like HAD superfamily hydrolase